MCPKAVLLGRERKTIKGYPKRKKEKNEVDKTQNRIQNDSIQRMMRKDEGKLKMSSVNELKIILLPKIFITA